MTQTWKILTLSLAVLCGVAGPTQAQEPPLVVELFTSQGCSSCPPADAALADLADRPDVLALSFHVDYWDYIGWRDPYASASYTQRQRSYARYLKERFVYTPQMVVGGAEHLVGSDRGKLRDVLAEERRKQAERGAGITLSLSADGSLAVDGPPQPAPRSLWLIGWDDRHETAVERGENRGRHLTNRNVVRSLILLGRWQGGAVELPLPVAQLQGDGGAAVLIQAEEVGPVLAALRLNR